MRATAERRAGLGCAIVAGLAALALAAAARADTAASPATGDNNPAQARTMEQAPATHASPNGQETVEVGGWPKVSFDTVASLDYAGMSSSTGPDRGPGFVFWSDSTLQVEFSPALS